MATDTASGSSHESNRENRTGRTAGGVVKSVARLVADLLIATVWVGFLALLFLETGWPRWAFYTALVLGIGVYVTVTAAWRRGGEATETDERSD